MFFQELDDSSDENLVPESALEKSETLETTSMTVVEEDESFIDVDRDDSVLVDCDDSMSLNGDESFQTDDDEDRKRKSDDESPTSKRRRTESTNSVENVIDLSTEETFPDVDEVVIIDDEASSKPGSFGVRCNLCSQYLDSVILLPPKSSDIDYMTERQIIGDSRVAVQGLDEGEEQQFTLFEYSIYDARGHLVPLDSELIEKGKTVKFSGKVQGVFGTSHGEGLNVFDCGPIIGWWITGLYSGETVNIGISTDKAFYFLRDPSHEYSPLMNVLNEKVSMLKAVYETMDDVKLNDDFGSFTYEDLLERLMTTRPELDSTHLLMQHGGFVVQQILSFEEADDVSVSYLLSIPFIKTMCDYSGFDRMKVTSQANRKLPLKSVRAPRISPQTLISKATTTPLVRQFFEHLFKDQLENGSSGNSGTLSRRCGVCGPCLSQDCGKCSVCQNRFDFGGKTSSSEMICVMKICEKQNLIVIDDCEDSIDNFKSVKKTSIAWPNSAVAKSGDKKFYSEVLINDVSFKNGDFVLVRSDDPHTPAYVCRILYMYQSREGKIAHAAHFCRGIHTVLGEVSEPREVFPVTDCEDVLLSEVVKKINVIYWEGPSNWCEVGGTEQSLWTPSTNQESIDFWYRLMYDPETGIFQDIPQNILHPTYEEGFVTICKICEIFRQKFDDETPKIQGNGFLWKNEFFETGDAVFLEPDTFSVQNSIRKGYKPPKQKKADEVVYPEYYRKWLQGGRESVKGNYSRMNDPFQIGIITKIKKIRSGEVTIGIRVLYRPENTQMSLIEICRSNWNLLFWTDNFIDEIPAAKVAGKCVVLPVNQLPHSEPTVWAQGGKYRFYIEKMYDIDSHKFEDLPDAAKNYRPPKSSLKLTKHPRIEAPLRTLDVFAGCGGLSVGLESSGVAKVKWGIEVYTPAAEAFGKNHPQAKVINVDCNEVLRIAMDNDGELINNQGIPRKGDVELMCGGPPCQGFSTMNAFTEREYSQFKRSAIVSYLSFCDFYRPKFFILENVRNFFVFKKSLMLKLCLSALVRMGYQVSFGVVQSGNFGVPQTRLRAFIMAAAPGEKIPRLPEPQNVFERSSLRTLVDEKCFEPNVRWSHSAPYRNVTTREAISDMPEIESGESRHRMMYACKPESHFQRIVRWSNEKGSMLDEVSDHICRKVLPLTQARMELIPQRPGADWRDLPNVRYRLNDGTVTDKLKYRYGKGVCSCMSGKSRRCDPADKQSNTIIPWSMVHTAKRNNQWMGCYGRVSNDSYFSTTITCPHPERKQGRVVHPTQNRIVSVRECARSQGFHDSFIFCGTILDKHRQIGNAVPPPLGRAVGLEIRAAIASKGQED